MDEKKYRELEEDARAMAKELERVYKEVEYALSMHLSGNPLEMRSALERILTLRS